MITIRTDTKGSAMHSTQNIPDGSKVTYMGEPATVIHGIPANDPWISPDCTNPPVINIRFDAPVRGMSRQLDVYASACLVICDSPEHSDQQEECGCWNFTHLGHCIHTV